MSTDHVVHTSQRNFAKLAGLGYLIIIACGIFAEFIVRMSLIEPGNADATASNILKSEGFFRLGIVGDLIMLSFDATVGLALYVLLRPINQSLALLATFFRLVHTAVYGVTLLTLFLVLQLLSGADYLTVFDQGQLNALVLLFADAHSYGYILSLVFFAVHVGILGYVGLKYGYFPRVLSMLLVFASAGYLVDSLANVLLSNYADYETVLGVVVFGPAVIGELSLALWLLLKGGRTPQGAHRGSDALLSPVRA